MTDPQTVNTPHTVPFAQVQTLCATQGLAAVAAMPNPGAINMTAYRQMLADGVGDMGYMERQEPLRDNLAHVMEHTVSVIAVSMPYQPSRIEQELKCARYAAGKDYHKILRKKLVQVASHIIDPQGQAYQSRACVDSAPLNERQLAIMAGIGWQGKNALVIHPKRGSYYFLGFLLTTAHIETHLDNQQHDRCGTCTRCETSCPTQALSQRRVLSERCISYLTIEHFGVIERALAQNFNGWWYGCDRCQEVCPWNRFALPAADSRLCGDDPEQPLLDITSDQFDSYFAGRPHRRIGYERFRRNLLVALWSLDRLQECQQIIAERLPLVLSQARELGLISHD